MKLVQAACITLIIALIIVTNFDLVAESVLDRNKDAGSEVAENASVETFEEEGRANDFDYLGTRTISGNTQYGSVYNRYYNENWIKQSWSSSTISRYNDAGTYVGNRNTISHSIALGTDSDGSLYIGDNSRTFYKFDRNGNQKWARNYNDGSQARGITCDDNYVYGLFNYGPILKLNKNTGAKVGVINPTKSFSNAFGMLYFNNMLIVSDSDHELLVYDMNGNHLRTIDPSYNSGNFGIVWTGREIQACEHNRNTWHRYSAVDLQVYTEDAALVDDESDENICYAGYKPYTFSVNLSTSEDLNDASEIKLYLDYNTTNATLGYNWTRNEFFKEQDPNGHIQLLTDNCTVTDDAVDRLWVNFSVMFNFTFPHEDQVDCFINTSSVAGEHTIDRFPHLCRVENDFEFDGTPFLYGDEQGRIEPDSWVKGNQNITASNLTVIYADSPLVYPDDEFFNVRISDVSGNIWWDNDSSGEGISIPIRSGNVTDPLEKYVFSIENIPDSGVSVSNLSVPVKIDAEPPDAPLNLLCHADDFKDRETENTNQGEMYVTWDEVEDPASGLAGYYFGRVDGSGTLNGTFITETRTEIDDLPEGYAPVYVWCIDNVGNVGKAAASGILVDITTPVFSNLTPPDGNWHNRSEVECSAEIWDGEGAGVDGSSIEYSVSADGINNFGVWIPAWMSTSSNRMVPVITYNFQEGEDNYIKWRAKDVAGNYLVESIPVQIKIDTAPIEFGEVLTPTENWFGEEEITTKIMVSDPGIGVDIDSLRARISTSGPGEFGEWVKIEEEDIAESGPGEFEITATFGYKEGKANYIMFRGTDLVGNPLAVSDKINLKVDTSSVYFTDFTPEEDTASDEVEVECFISIMDDGAGVSGNTIEYSISTNGKDEKEFGPWKRPLNVVVGNPTQVLVQVKFEWGSDNYIRWRADDKIGTGMNTSRPYRIWTNSEPEPVILSPYPGEKYKMNEEIFFDGSGSEDLDGDNLTFFWTSNIVDNRTLSHVSSFRAKLVPGNHTITMFVSDGHGFNVSKKVKIDIEKITAPGGGGGNEEGNLLSTGGNSDLWLYFIIIAVVLVIVTIVIILIVIRKKKDDNGDTTPDRRPEVLPYAAPQPHPYPQGGYHPEMQQGYLQQDYGQQGYVQQGYVRQGHPGTDPVTGQRLPQLNQGIPGSSPYPALPPGPQPPTTGQDHTGAAAGTAYLLPSFDIDGAQNLNLLALPPGQDPLPFVADGTIDPNPTASLPGPDTSSFGADGTPDPDPTASLPGPDTSSFGGFPSPGGEYPATPFQEMEAAPIPGPAAAPLPVGEWAVPGEIAPLPALPPTAPPPAPAAISTSTEPSFPANPAPEPVTTEIVMQCHACGNNYTTTVHQFPAVVTCSHCMTQGMIEHI